jgi:NADH-ubiquinone oxidoreductase chain 2
MFSFIGLPPLVGFFGKQMVLSTALDNNKIILVLIGVLTSVIGAVYYLTVIKTIYFDNSQYEKTYMYVDISISNIYSITLSIINLGIISFIFMPNEILNLCNLLSVLTFSIS